jgi:hypothetical protein
VSKSVVDLLELIEINLRKCKRMVITLRSALLGSRRSKNERLFGIPVNGSNCDRFVLVRTDLGNDVGKEHINCEPGKRIPKGKTGTERGQVHTVDGRGDAGANEAAKPGLLSNSRTP